MNAPWTRASHHATPSNLAACFNAGVDEGTLRLAMNKSHARGRLYKTPRCLTLTGLVAGPFCALGLFTGSSAHFAITATVAHAFLAALFFVHACPTESRASVVLTIVPPITPALDISADSARPDVDPFSKLDGRLLRGS